MEIIDKVIKSEIPPKDLNVIWFNTQNNQCFIFHNGWIPMNKNQTLLLTVDGNSEELGSKLLSNDQSIDIRGIPEDLSAGRYNGLLNIVQENVTLPCVLDVLEQNGWKMSFLRFIVPNLDTGRAVEYAIARTGNNPFGIVNDLHTWSDLLGFDDINFTLNGMSNELTERIDQMSNRIDEIENQISGQSSSDEEPVE